MLRIKILVYVELGLAREGSVVCPDICDICEFLPTATTPELATPTPIEDEAITTLLDDVSTPPAELATSPPTPTPERETSVAVTTRPPTIPQVSDVSANNLVSGRYNDGR